MFPVCVFVWCGCERHTGDNQFIDVPVNIDWGTETDIPEHIKLLLFRMDDGLLISTYIDPRNDIIQIPYGEYRVLMYNWRSNDDEQCIRFENEKDYYSCRAYTDFKSNSMFNEDILVQPDILYSWSTKDETILINEESSMTRAGTANTINIVPAPAVSHHTFSIFSTGLQYVKNAEATITGVSRYKLIYNQETTGTPHTISVNLTPKTDNIECSISTFGFVPGETNLLTLKFRLTDNTNFEVSYDLTKDIAMGRITDITTPIIIPKVAGEETFIDPDIGEWEDTSDEIVF